MSGNIPDPETIKGALGEAAGLVLFFAATAAIYGLQEGVKHMLKKYNIDLGMGVKR